MSEFSDFILVFKWWLCILAIGLLALPISISIFNKFFDKGYIFSKTIGIGILSYSIFILGTFHIFPFNRLAIVLILTCAIAANIFLIKKKGIRITKRDIRIFLFQEGLFLGSLLLWTYVKMFQPDIHGLEKYMDFGFINSILRSTYFPPVDMWFPPLSINYYYFGHLVTAILTKLTNISPFITYNFMLATIFAFTVTSAFSLVATITNSVLKLPRTSFFAGLLGGVIASLGGNLQTIYAFFIAYTPAENPVPFWTLKFAPDLFPNAYWYPNATRFVPFTIHEFPSYSFVVSDLHGHVLDIPFVFLTLALTYSMFLSKKISYRISILIALFLSIMYMTNAWDGIIYFLLFVLAIFILKSNVLKMKKISKKTSQLHIKRYSLSRITNKISYAISSIKHILITAAFYFLFLLPFSLSFKPFVSGIGVLCAPDFLTNIGKLGPILFEADHCQRSPFWMLIILYGFFYFFVIALVIKIMRIKKPSMTLIFVLLIILLSTLLIAIPEFIYAKDIYPAHYRANTMFKLGYQAFIMLSLISSFAIAYLFHKGRKIIWFPPTFILLALILMYPYFAVSSYFSDLKVNKGIDGFSYLKSLYPNDHAAILWIQNNIKGQPILLEAQGDSYTDYGRVSANTGLPTPLGWTVHEWLWRGDYSFPQSRLEDIRLLYEGDIATTRDLIRKYKISYVIVGGMERTKYPNINEEKFLELGEIIFQSGDTKLFRLK